MPLDGPPANHCRKTSLLWDINRASSVKQGIWRVYVNHAARAIGTASKPQRHKLQQFSAMGGILRQLASWAGSESSICTMIVDCLGLAGCMLAEQLLRYASQVRGEARRSLEPSSGRFHIPATDAGRLKVKCNSYLCRIHKLTLILLTKLVNLNMIPSLGPRVAERTPVLADA
jgi:hypothetical protein